MYMGLLCKKPWGSAKHAYKAVKKKKKKIEFSKSTAIESHDPKTWNNSDLSKECRAAGPQEHLLLLSC